MWLIITVVTCVMIEFHITFSCSHHQPQVPTLPLPLCWGMWAFTTTPHQPHTTHVNYVPHWPHHVDHMPHTTSMSTTPHQRRHNNPHHINHATSTSATYPNNNRTQERRQDTRRGGQGGNGMRRCDEAKEGAGQCEPCQLCQCWQWHKPRRWPWRCTPCPTLTGRTTHATLIPSHVNANHVDLGEDASHVDTQPRRRWDLSLPPPLYCSYNVIKYSNAIKFEGNVSPTCCCITLLAPFLLFTLIY